MSDQVKTKQVTTEFFVVFQIKKGRYGIDVSAKRLCQKRPTKVSSTEFFVKMCVSVPADYLKRPEPTATLELDHNQMGDLSLLVAERLKEQ